MWRIEEKIHFDGIGVFRHCHVRRGFAQAESTTAESRSETRTTVDRNGTIAERVRQTESRTTVSSETKGQ